MLSDVSDPVNIGNPNEISMLDLAREIVELTGSKSEIAFKKLPEDDPKIRQPDTSRANSLLNWEARVSRRDGLLKTIDYFRSQLS